MATKFQFDLGKAQLKNSSRISALLAGFAVIALVELIYETNSPRWLLLMIGVLTVLLVSIHLLALMMSTCIQPYMQTSQEVDESILELKFYIDLSWLFSTCVGLIILLAEIGLIFYYQFRIDGFEHAGWMTLTIMIPVCFTFVLVSCFINRIRADLSIERLETKIGIIFYFKFQAIGFAKAGWVTSAILVPVLIVFILISCLIHKNRASHSIERMDRKISNLRHIISTKKYEMAEQYLYDLKKAQLKASSNTSALLSGFAMIALVELHYDADTPHWLLIMLGVVTALLVSVHLLALMISTCIQPYMQAAGPTQYSPHIRLKFLIDLSWFFSTCVGLILFLASSLRHLINVSDHNLCLIKDSDMVRFVARGELSMADKYTYVLSKAQLKASSNTSALLAGFAMVCLVELQYDEHTPHGLMIVLGVVTALLVSVHLLALMMSTCILPYMEASGATQDSPHIRLKFYIDLSWFFSTCIGLILFLVEIGLIFYVKFRAIDFEQAGWITTAILIPVLFVFVIISCFIHRSRANYSFDRIDSKVSGLKKMLNSSEENIALMKVV
ncbi:hypothetical protein PRIPAC_81731 [Pristionchus pacificus]|uniref:Protein orai n=1 Tax=Pristionchus pacificus TaxID=54126 RepID=A0A2A6C3L0_PRIPA|nr:hypothetical protein PRIPAC_81731 [Pristionchus pacificus]|eukprot:PDM72822.1 orai-1 [Pristionchus pacificus]